MHDLIDSDFFVNSYLLKLQIGIKILSYDILDYCSMPLNLLTDGNC